MPIGIWEISQMPGYLRFFPNAWVSEIFSKCLAIWEISPNTHRTGNFQDTQAFGKFPKFPKYPVI